MMAPHACNTCMQHLRFTPQLGDEASDKVLEIEQVYSRKRRPVYLKRNEIIATIPHFWQVTFSHACAC